MLRVLVTGADGFIGSHLVDRLIEDGHTVQVIDNLYTGNKDFVHSKAQFVELDIRDPSVCSVLEEFRPDYIFHEAAQTEVSTSMSDPMLDCDINLMGLINLLNAAVNLAALIAIPYSYIAPDSYVDTNIKGTLNICQAAKENGVKRILVTSTSEVYGTARYVPIDEKHPKQPQSPYSATKIGADAIALSFFNAFQLPVVIVRPFNTYGPRQSARAIIPTIITQIASGCKEIKLGDLSPTRDFNYVKDTCRGFIELSKCDAAIGEEVNICSNYEISMKDTLKLIAKLMNSDVKFVEDTQRLRPQSSEVFRLWGDNTKIKKLTGFTSCYSIEDGLRETISWFKDELNLKKYKSDIYNV